MADVPMPNDVTAWMDSMAWGRHHIRWHVERIWDRLPPEAIAWAQQNGWARYPLQEGEETNGLAFLAMHRVMIRKLVAQFPAHAALFAGWASPPTDPNDANDPIPANSPIPGAFSPNMSASITRIGTAPASFDGDDDFGLYTESGWRPFPNQPTRRSPDASTGIHNYIHGRFTDETSAIDMGDPEVNLRNQRFWRLHGWIDGKWSGYRTASGRTETDPAYKAALEEAEHHMMQMAPMMAPEAAAVKVPPQIKRIVSRTLFSG